MTFFRSAAAAQQARYRACKRCRPDATPGSPLWNTRADITARALRLITDGFLDRLGVGALANELSVSERHLNRMLTDELGAGPIALARAQRAQTARLLIETTVLPFGQIAFAAGFSSIRQFNDTVLEVFAQSPSAMRARLPRARCADVQRQVAGSITVRLPFRSPFDVRALFGFLEMRCLPGIDELVTANDVAHDGTHPDAPNAQVSSSSSHLCYRRSMMLPAGEAVIELAPRDNYVSATFHLTSMADLGAAIARSRALLDLDADPVAIDTALAADDTLRTHILSNPGRRSPGAVDAHELCVRAVLGQQVSVAAARTIARRLVERLGTPLANPIGGVTRLFPSASVLASESPEHIGIPLARGRALIGLSTALADGTVRLGPGVDRADAQRSLVALPGIGPWTASYIAMRALSDPDVLLATDLIVRQGAKAIGLPSEMKELAHHGDRWRPWGSYVTHHLWSVATAMKPTNDLPATHAPSLSLARTHNDTLTGAVAS